MLYARISQKSEIETIHIILCIDALNNLNHKYKKNSFPVYGCMTKYIYSHIISLLHSFSLCANQP